MTDSLDPRQPVLVGVGQVTETGDDPTLIGEPVDLMAQASRAAADDSGAPSLLGRVRWAGVPAGSWAYRDPARLVLERLGHPAPGEPHTVLAEIGVLQHSLWQEAARRIAAGELDVALVVGGEARARAGAAARAGLDLPDTTQTDSVRPDEQWATDDVGISDMELERGLHQPSSAYALMESAIGHAAGRTSAEHVEYVSELWARFGSAAADNPHAWDRSAPDAATIARPTADNRTISHPYTRLLCSQWTVNQAAALLLCSVEAARAAGVPEERWVFPRLFTENRRPEPVSQRSRLDRLFGARVASETLWAESGLSGDDVAHLDLYSCFPAAVEIYARELGIDLDRDLTQTGGLTFGGGPLNNYTLQSTAAMAETLRSDPGSIGLVTIVSAFLSKQGYDLWSTTPPPSGHRSIDCTAEVESRLELPPVAPDRNGPVDIVAFTVEHSRGEPWQALIVGEHPDGARALATSQDHHVLGAMMQGEWIGTAASVDSGGTFRL